MTEYGKYFIRVMTERRAEIPVDLYEAWLQRQGYKRVLSFWERAR